MIVQLAIFKFCIVCASFSVIVCVHCINRLIYCISSPSLLKGKKENLRMLELRSRTSKNKVKKRCKE